MEESDGVFAKRRRNLLIVGVVIIIISVANPDIKVIEIFGIDFDFTGKIWLIWLGLTLWLFYVIMRVYSFYNTIIKVERDKARNKFIYSDGEGRVYWLNILKIFSKELSLELRENAKNQQEKEMSFVVQTPFEDLLESYIEEGKIWISFQCRNRERKMIGRAEDKEVNFEILPEKKAYFSKRKRLYKLDESWWEYSFIFGFGIISVMALIFGWIRVFSCI